MKPTVLSALFLLAIASMPAHAIGNEPTVIVPLMPATDSRTGESFESWWLNQASLPQALRGDPWAFDFSGLKQIEPPAWPIGATWLEIISGPSWISTEGPMGVAGIATSAAGQYALTVRGVSERYGPTEEVSYSLTVNDWRLNDATMPNAARKESYSFSIANLLEIFPGDYNIGALNWSAAGLPAGLQMQPSGVISGTPEEASIDFGEGHRFSVEVTAARSTGQIRSQTYDLFVAQTLDSWSLDPATLPTGARGDAYSGFSFAGRYTVTPSNFDLGAVTWSASGLPAGMSLSSAGQLGGTPTAAGDFTLAVTANSENGGSRSGNYALTIEQTLDEWSLDAATLPEGERTVAYSGFSFAGRYTLVPADYDIGQLTWSATGLPGGMSLSNDGVLSGTPSNKGNYTISVTARSLRDGDRSRDYSLLINESFRTLSVNSTGNTAVAIGSSTGHAGTTSYTNDIPEGDLVKLLAPTEAGNYVFASWDGCSSAVDNVCDRLMDADRTVTANYFRPDHTLSVRSSGATGVAITSTQVADGATDFSRTRARGVDTTLTAPAEHGNFVFSGWTGCSSVGGTGNRDCTVSNIRADETVTAAYTRPNHTITVNSSGTTGVAISSSQVTNGTTNFSRTRARGVDTTLTAPAEHGNFVFSGWTGCSSVGGTGNRDCTVSNIRADETVTAAYTRPNHTITVNSSGTTGVAITSSQVTNGTTNFSRSRPRGANTTFTAPAEHGNFVFSSWSGCSSVSGRNCTVSNIRSNQTVTANYTRPNHTITVNSSGTTGVAITSPNVSDGSTNFSRSRPRGANTTFTAPAWHGNYQFTGWSGCSFVTGTGNRDCIVSNIRSNQTITANYTRPNHTISVRSSGTTGVTISSTQVANGTTNFSRSRPRGANTTFTAPAEQGNFVFSSWSGCSSVSGRNCTVSNIRSNRTITANYQAMDFTLRTGLSLSRHYYYYNFGGSGNVGDKPRDCRKAASSGGVIYKETTIVESWTGIALSELSWGSGAMNWGTDSVRISYNAWAKSASYSASHPNVGTKNGSISITWSYNSNSDYQCPNGGSTPGCKYGNPVDEKGLCTTQTTQPEDPTGPT